MRRTSLGGRGLDCTGGRGRRWPGVVVLTHALDVRGDSPRGSAVCLLACAPRRCRRQPRSARPRPHRRRLKAVCGTWIADRASPRSRRAESGACPRRGLLSGCRLISFVVSSTLGSCHSVCGVVWVSGMSSVSMGCWQVEQRPVQHLKRGCRSSTALGSVRPAVGDLGAGAPGSGSRERR